jgi:hypothetical protein
MGLFERFQLQRALRGPMDDDYDADDGGLTTLEQRGPARDDGLTTLEQRGALTQRPAIRGGYVPPNDDYGAHDLLDRGEPTPAAPLPYRPGVDLANARPLRVPRHIGPRPFDPEWDRPDSSFHFDTDQISGSTHMALPIRLAEPEPGAGLSELTDRDTDLAPGPEAVGSMQPTQPKRPGFWRRFGQTVAGGAARGVLGRDADNYVETDLQRDRRYRAEDQLELENDMRRRTLSLGERRDARDEEKYQYSRRQIRPRNERRLDLQFEGQQRSLRREDEADAREREEYEYKRRRVRPRQEALIDSQIAENRAQAQRAGMPAEPKEWEARAEADALGYDYDGEIKKRMDSWRQGHYGTLGITDELIRKAQGNTQGADDAREIIRRAEESLHGRAKDSVEVDVKQRRAAAMAGAGRSRPQIPRRAGRPRDVSPSAALEEYRAFVRANPSQRDRARRKFMRQNGGVDPEGQ